MAAPSNPLQRGSVRPESFSGLLVCCVAPYGCRGGLRRRPVERGGERGNATWGREGERGMGLAGSRVCILVLCMCVCVLRKSVFVDRSIVRLGLMAGWMNGWLASWLDGWMAG